MVPRRGGWPVEHQQLQQPVRPVLWSVGLPVQADVWGRRGGDRRGIRKGQTLPWAPPLPAAPGGCRVSHTQGGGGLASQCHFQAILVLGQSTGLCHRLHQPLPSGSQDQVSCPDAEIRLPVLSPHPPFLLAYLLTPGPFTPRVPCLLPSIL